MTKMEFFSFVVEQFKQGEMKDLTRGRERNITRHALGSLGLGRILCQSLKVPDRNHLR